METQQDPPIMAELMQWCSRLVKGREARRKRVPVLFKEFEGVLGDQWPVITVTGTSGKGTTCVLLEAVLAASGHTPGVCIKPHLFAFRERIRVAGRSVSNAELAESADVIFSRLRAFVRKHGPEYQPSLFEALLLVAAAIFGRRGVSITVIEAAIGGSNDATSFLPAVLSVITSVDLDHQAELGNSIEAIARDKAGIAPPGGVLVLGAGLSEVARSVAASEATARGVECIQARGDDIEVMSSRLQDQTIRLAHRQSGSTVLLPFTGPHQGLNFATVWKATQVLHQRRYIASLDAIRGVERAFLPGRFEFIQGSPSWLLDVAHNPASVRAVLSAACQHLPPEKIIAVFGATEPHDYRGMLEAIGAQGIRIAFCEGFPRALSVHRLAAEVAAQVQPIGLFHSPGQAIEYFASPEMDEDAVVLVTGSLFLVGQWRHELALRGLVPPERE